MEMDKETRLPIRLEELDNNPATQDIVADAQVCDS